MRKIKVVKEYCPQNHRCPVTPVCPVDAIYQEGYSAPKINYDKCIGCGRCVQSCSTFQYE